MTALYLHPEEHVGDRCAVLFIAFLILVTNMQTDLGLGAVTQLLWIDIFNIVQLLMVLVSVGESAVVHVLLKQQNERLAIALDQVLKIAIPFVLYPIGTIATIIGAQKANIVNLRLDNRDTGFHTNTIDVEVHDVHHLMHVIGALRAADAVNSVVRV